MSSFEHFWAKISKLSIKLVLEFSYVWSCCKIGQGHPKVIIWTILVALQYSMQISNVKAIDPLVQEKKICKWFYHEQAWWQNWSYDLDYLNNLFFPQPKGPLYEILWYLAVAFKMSLFGHFLVKLFNNFTWNLMFSIFLIALSLP